MKIESTIFLHLYYSMFVVTICNILSAITSSHHVTQ